MPVHFNYQGHVGQDPRKRGEGSALTKPSRLNIVLGAANQFTISLERALGDLNPEEYEVLRARVQKIQEEALVLVNKLPVGGMFYASKPK